MPTTTTTAGSNDSGTKAMNALQAQWYNTLVKGLNLDPDRFQLAQPTAPLGNTSDLLWSYFNNIPPLSLTGQFAASGGNRFYDDYKAVLSQLSSQGDGSFQQDLGDNYGPWMAYVSTLNPLPKLEDLPDIFRTWATFHCPSVAQKGASDLAAALIDPIYQAQVAIRNTAGFMNGVPNYSQTIADLRGAIPQAPSQTVTFDSSSASSDTSHTWAKGEASGMYDFFSADVGGSYDQLSEKAATSSVTVDATFSHVLTFSAGPGAWYVSSALGAAYATPDNTMWKHGTPSWTSTFGPTGNMLRFTSGLIVVDGIDATVTSDATYSSSDQLKITAQASVGVWPFFSFGASGGHSTATSFDSEGRMTVKVLNPPGNPCVLGVNVEPVQTYLGGS
jgi:hypothetical protein